MLARKGPHVMDNGRSKNSKKLSSSDIPMTKKLMKSQILQKHVTFGASNELLIKPLELSKSQFIEMYSRGSLNLSNLPCPPFIEADGFFTPPEFYNEHSRLCSVPLYEKLPHWSETFVFKRTISTLKKKFQCTGVSISLVGKKSVDYKVETTLNLKVLPRYISIDSHSILSKDYFLLLDASQDWRFCSNPLILKSPSIKFYCGVPLISTNKNQIVGCLAIFDQLTKDSFPESSIEMLQMVAKDLMITLSTPIEEVKNNVAYLPQKKPKEDFETYYSTLNSLEKKIGRPTGSTDTLVFEKDGSGGPYIQNQNAKYLNYKSFKGEEMNNPDLSKMISEKELWRFLLSVGSMKKAASVISRVLATNFKFELVYILEIRVAELYQIPREYYPNEDNLDCEKFKFLKKLVKVKNVQDEFMTRVIGLHVVNQSIPSNDFFKSSVHQKCFNSEFGLEIRNKNDASIFSHGILQPFHKFSAIMARKTLGCQQPLASNKMLDVYLKSGGFLIGLFNEKSNIVYDSGLISNIFHHASIYRRIYIDT